MVACSLFYLSKYAMSKWTLELNGERQVITMSVSTVLTEDLVQDECRQIWHEFDRNRQDLSEAAAKEIRTQKLRALMERAIGPLGTEVVKRVFVGVAKSNSAKL